MSGDTGGGRSGPKESPKRQRPLKRPRVGWPRPLRTLKDQLYEVYLAAGAPSLDEISGDIADDDALTGAPSRDTVHRVITDGERPGQQADVVAVATVLARRAAWDAPDLAVRVRELWVQAGMAKGAGRPISELRSDVRLVLDGGLGVHPALDTGGASDRFGILPAYIPRDHDRRLKAVVNDAAAGRSGIVVLVGGSSTGKTRALWEALGELPDSWRLWHPLSPTAPDATLAALADIAPKTVVWLNEAQHYLDPDPLGEQVAAGLRVLLNDPSRAPVLVLGTLWPEHWDTLTTRTSPDRHAGARELLGGHKIDVPDAFTAADLAVLDTCDPRLAQAAQHAKGTQITQYLAGVPSLMDRYHAARGATLALIHAAMDARRLGAGLHLPLDWLADAAPGYLDDDEYHTLDANWLTQALAYVTTPCNGIPAILTLVTTSGPRNQRTRRRPAEHGTPASQPARSDKGPLYLLADYLEQHSRHQRAEIIPPIDFWTAAAHHAHPADLATLGDAAGDRGLYRDAAQLHKHATTHGDPQAALTLVTHLHNLHPTDPKPAQWAATHVALSSPAPLGTLLRALRKVRAEGQVDALLARDPSAHVALTNTDAVAGLLRVLHEIGAEGQVTILAERAAAHVPLNDAFGVAGLLRLLLEVGAEGQVTILAERAAAHVPLDEPDTVAGLLRPLREVGADGQVTILAERAAAHVALDDAYGVAGLLQELQVVGAEGQVTILAERAAAHVPLDDPSAVWLLWALQQVGADGQVDALLARDPAAHVALDAFDSLLEALQVVGADGQVTILAERAVAHVALDDANAVAGLLRSLRKVGADGQVAALLARDPVAHVALTNVDAVERLVQALQEVGADGQVTILAERAVAHVAFDDAYAVAGLLRVLGRAGATEQVAALAERAATHVALTNPDAVASLLWALWEARADGQVAALLARDPVAHVALTKPEAVTSLLQALWEVGAEEQVTTLTERAVPQVALDNAYAVGRLLQVLREVRADVQITALAERAAKGVALTNPDAVTWLLRVLRRAGADQYSTTLAERLPAAGHCDTFFHLEKNREQFRLGREPDGSAAPSWTWNDLD
ncbi:hypothetical protein [Streptomyces chartreusis]|uniref:hypothetical protein n=1 Tax=Streptomyces chartreusis TaxID=1969 RepID=UPI0036FDEECB